ncbi:hypothetical protein B7494_g7990 [Chlorociboria aeruginascens]|nr:hypothetical protein B7494_g7990 [Chlorociboria aeruginascens]
MAFNFRANTNTYTSDAPDSPFIKRQKLASGYTSGNVASAYNSDVDDGDDLFEGYVPDTPAKFETQPTQILDRNAQPPSSPATPTNIIQVPASSPFRARDDNISSASSQRVNAARSTLAQSMAPAGTSFRPPFGITKPPLRKQQVINLDSDDEVLHHISSEDEIDDRANIQPSTFTSKSFGGFPINSDLPKTANGTAKFQSILANASYNATGMRPGPTLKRKPEAQRGPERARPVEDISIDMVEAEHREKVKRLRSLYPNTPTLLAMNTLLSVHGNFNEAASLLADHYDKVWNTIVPSDDESSLPVKRADAQTKRGLKAPIASIRDKYSSTQAFSTQRPAEPEKKRKLVKGRRNPSPTHASFLAKPPSSPILSDREAYASDSGVGTEAEQDPHLDDRVLKYLNTCTAKELVELTNISPPHSEIMVAARPFRNMDAARSVSNATVLKSGKKSTKAPMGDRIVDTAIEMFRGYEAVDTLVAKCEAIGKPLAEEMSTWGFDVFGAAKGGELEVVSLEDTESLRDSAIGSPSSNGNGDDEVKVTAPRRKQNVKFLKKPDLMAEDIMLKDYQIVGLNWLALMWRHKMSCILADEMGLGKTCQVISFLSHLAEIGVNGPHLVICPGSTLENWLREFQRFAPQLVVEPYYGAAKDRAEMADKVLENRNSIDVIVSTYDMARKPQDNKFMRKLRPTVCVYDEGHYLKNANSQRYQGLVKIPAQMKLLLTGTPLQNNLQELAALLGFMLPEVFNDLQEDLNFIFKAKATTSDANHTALLSAQRIARARSMLTPFVLRRKKAQVLKHLPAKTCRVEYCSLHPDQKQIYDGHLEQARERARLRIEGGKIPKSDENNPLMQLRKAAIHPLLFRRHFTNAKIEKMTDILRAKEKVHFPPEQKREHVVNEMRAGSDFFLHRWCVDFPCIASFDIPDLSWLNSGKVDALVKLVEEYEENGDRVLIFSQFSLVLDILEPVLSHSLIQFTRIDGSTKIDERQSIIDTFRDDESITAFLLTTKAGGTGINLMYANKVIIFDGSFNPQDDRQAENRAHRVGQTRPVEVVRLVTRNTVEEQIWALGNSKLELDGRVAGDDEGAGEEAGEKAISRMLLEGTGKMNDEDAKAKTEDASDEKKAEPQPEKKRKSLLQMATQVDVDEDGEETLV